MNSALASILLAALPIAALVVVFRGADSARPEPKRIVFVTMAMGFAICVPVAVVEFAMQQLLGPVGLWGGRFLDAYLVAAFTEECAKLFVVVAFAYRHPAFDEVMDGVTYTVAASLGFGLLENLIFLSSPIANFFGSLPGVHGVRVPPQVRVPLVLGIVRGLTAVPMHAIASGLMGYFIGRARFADVSLTGDAFHDVPDVLPERIPRPIAWGILGLASAVAMHGTYDWAVFATGTRNVIFLELPLILLAGALMLHRLVLHALHLDDLMRGPGRRSSLVNAFRPPPLAPPPLAPPPLAPPPDESAL